MWEPSTVPRYEVPRPSHVEVGRGIGVDLGAIHRDQTHPHQPSLSAQPQYLYKHLTQSGPVPIVEPGDRGMVRLLDSIYPSGLRTSSLVMFVIHALSHQVGLGCRPTHSVRSPGSCSR